MNLAVKVSDDLHIGLNIPRRDEGRPDSHGFALVINKAERDGHLGPLSDVIETRLPMRRFLAGSLRGNRHRPLLAAAEGLNDLFHHVEKECNGNQTEIQLIIIRL